MVLGIDIGGTSLKFGLVSPNGDITAHKKYETTPFVKNGFERSMAAAIKEYLKEYPGLLGVGMGFPGLLSADRKRVILLPNIPGVKDMLIVDYLAKEIPGLKVKIENDAKCAALGEFQFGPNKGQDNFVCVTLGTGVGSGAIINRQLFIGARGNGMEIGHMLMGGGKTMEQQIGLYHLLDYAKDVVNQSPESILYNKDLNTHLLREAAERKDKAALKVFDYLGTVLGEAMVSVIRVLDLDCIIVGGGISNAFEFFLPSMEQAIRKNLPSYYTSNLKIKKASLSNDAGLLGAAGLIMLEHETLGMEVN
jgi:glucokinase